METLIEATQRMAKTLEIWVFWQTSKYRKVMSSNTSHLEAHVGFFRLLMKGIFDPLCTVSFWQKVDFLISNVR